ncbi:putative monooxygenase [Moniliophthora roreri MCA 2997]|uniref:Monooxygenase n=1 Tax=Moniliophthora roreri (strain MCA 2997) TaxID=1381753 RepID=V2WMX5_MONRO|nr:putative monooxygenase [Moniliophthora roreri MCA 2997]
MTTQPVVLIVGAGPSGLALALLLLRNGIPVRIIDARSDFNVGYRGAGFQPRTLELYKLLGILSNFEERTTTIPLVKFYTPGQDRPFREASFLEYMPLESRYYRINARVFGQEQHQELLREVLQKDYGCKVERETELVGFIQNEDNVVANLTCHGKRETTTVQWLVGADGARSTVRRQLGLTFLGETHADVTMVVGDIEIQKGGEAFDAKAMSIWGAQSEKTASLYPYTKDGKKMVCFMLGGAQMHVEEVVKSHDSILDVLRGISGKNDVEFGALYQHGLWRANVRMANKFGEGRIFIVGDAAHVHSPTGGQGMNSGVQDSFNLAWKLALVHKGLAPRSLLESYTSERLPVITTMLEMTTAIMQRDLILTGQPGRWTRAFELRQLGITYRNSPIIVDERYPNEDAKVDPYRSGLDGTVHAGDRAPEAPGLKPWESGEKTSIFEVFDTTSHTLLLFGKSTSDVQDLLEVMEKYPRNLVKSVLVLPQTSTPSSVNEKAPFDKIFVDVDGHAYQNYRVTPGDTFAVLVRPDGYIGALAKGASGLKEYFGKLLN